MSKSKRFIIIAEIKPFEASAYTEEAFIDFIISMPVDYWLPDFDIQKMHETLSQHKYTCANFVLQYKAVNGMFMKVDVKKVPVVTKIRDAVKFKNATK